MFQLVCEVRVAWYSQHRTNSSVFIVFSFPFFSSNVALLVFFGPNAVEPAKKYTTTICDSCKSTMSLEPSCSVHTIRSISKSHTRHSPLATQCIVDCSINCYFRDAIHDRWSRASVRLPCARWPVECLCARECEMNCTRQATE